MFVVDVLLPVAKSVVGVQQVRRTRAWAKVWGQSWGSEEAEAVASVLARAQALADAEVIARVEEARAWPVAGPSLLTSEAALEAPAQAWAQVWVASAWARELAEVRKRMSSWMVGLGQGQWQALRQWTLECKVQVEHGLWPRYRQDCSRLIQIITPIARLPPELHHQILLIVVDYSNNSPLALMRVSRYWYTIVTGIWAPIKLGTTTPKDVVRRRLGWNQWPLDVVVDTEIDRGQVTPSEDSYQAIFTAISATSRWRTLEIDTFPAPADLPEDLINRGLQQCFDPVMSHLRTLIIKCPCEMSPLLDRLLRILGNTASRELTTVTINSPIVISFLVPTYSSIFRSVTVLSLDTPGLPNPVDLLPHLHRLEALTASHLPLPVYDDDDDFPFAHTLRHLTLRAVSIQWMSGRTFHALESCSITFPLHRHVLHTFRTTLPNCQNLSFEGYPLDILSGVSAHKLTHLSVKCPSSYKSRGGRELALFSSQTLQEGRLEPQILHISIEATNEAWSMALASMSNLEELVIGNAQPSSLGVKTLRLLVVYLGTTASPGEWNTPACPSLKRFGLRYRRWLRPGEHFDLAPVFMSILRSRKWSLQSFRIWRGSDDDDPLELIDGSRIEPMIKLCNRLMIKDCNQLTIERCYQPTIKHIMYENRPVSPTPPYYFYGAQKWREVVAWLALDITSLPTCNAKPWSAIRTSRKPWVNIHRTNPAGPNILSIEVVVLEATKYSPKVYFQCESGIIKVTKGIARVHFVIHYPADRDEDQYYRFVGSFMLVPILLLTSLEQFRSRLIRMAF
jgi:hypothetical protein